MAEKPRVRVPAIMADSLVNVISKAGTGADKRSYDQYAATYTDKHQVEMAYAGNWLARKIVDLPAYEMTRAGRDWQAEDNQISLLEDYEKRVGLWPKVRAALTLARLYGGSVMLLGVGDNELPMTPLAIERLGKDALKWVSVLSRYQITVGLPVSDMRDPMFGTPSYFEIDTATGKTKIHPSRVIPFLGQMVPAGANSIGDGSWFWGDPVLRSIDSAVKNATRMENGVASLVDVMKTDVLSIPRLSERLATAEYEDQLTRRVSTASLFQSMFGVKLVDAGDGVGSGESWTTQQISFSTLPETIESFRRAVSGAADIPHTRLYGQAPAGMNATGESDGANFDSMIASRQESDLRPSLERLDALLIPSALGTRPDTVYWTFAPLNSSDPKELAEIEKLRAETFSEIVASNLMPPDVAAKVFQNAATESGQYPGIEKALDEAAKELAIEPVAEPDDPSQVIPMARAANDGKPMVMSQPSDLSPSRDGETADEPGADNRVAPDRTVASPVRPVGESVSWGCPVLARSGKRGRGELRSARAGCNRRLDQRCRNRTGAVTDSGERADREPDHGARYMAGHFSRVAYPEMGRERHVRHGGRD